MLVTYVTARPSTRRITFVYLRSAGVVWTVYISLSYAYAYVIIVLAYQYQWRALLDDHRQAIHPRDLCYKLLID